MISLYFSSIYTHGIKGQSIVLDFIRLNLLFSMSSQQQYSIKSTNSGVSVETAHTQYDSEKYTSDIKRRELYKRFLTWIGSGEIEPGMETISYPSYFGKIQRLISYNPENIRYGLYS